MLAASHTFKAEHAQIWVDHKPHADEKEALDKANNTLDSMSENINKLSWDQDCLRLAADVATVGKLLEAEQQTERARHIAKVLHLKSQ